MSLDSWWGADLLQRGAEDAVWAIGTRQVTNAALRTEVARLASLFRLQGIRPGHAVALQGVPSFTQLWSTFALWSLGAQVLQLDPRVTGRERASLLELCAPRYLVGFGGMTGGPGVFVDECEVIVRRMPGDRPARTAHCLVQFSSGTAGRVKAIGRTPESLLAEVDRFATLAEMPQRGERVLLLDPITHSFGLLGGVLHGLNTGATIVFPTGGPRNARDVHVIFGNPRHFDLIASSPDRPAPPRLRLAVSCGDTLPHQVYEDFARRFGVRIGQAYGTTETGIVATDLGGGLGHRTVGAPMPGIRTRIANGVLEVHVPQSPYLYEDEPWVGGWLSTGDLITAHPDTGVLWLRGRADHIGASGNAELDLLGMEAVLRRHRQVSDVVVLGADPVEAHVAGPAELTPDELVSWCRRFLGHTGAPSRYHVVRRLPRTANGKILRSRRLLHERGLGA